MTNNRNTHTWIDRTLFKVFYWDFSLYKSVKALPPPPFPNLLFLLLAGAGYRMIMLPHYTHLLDSKHRPRIGICTAYDAHWFTSKEVMVNVDKYLDMFSRSWKSQGLLYKNRCHSLIKEVCHLFLSCLYGAAKLKPFVKKTMMPRLRVFLISKKIQLASLVQKLWWFGWMGGFWQ